ncbi:receptor-like protein kinase HSL1 [Heracleum sosnowskyi]|uniref:Receptor-like protein kinase HSL1 n=1 Tax=Heracleum sosnowskyi TaxID=360622 RepID=A0AAD8I2B7_9APIA|nr:receptor-like protein kinase HSL1 [Heracleum sosnowskyi]
MLMKFVAITQNSRISTSMTTLNSLEILAIFFLITLPFHGNSQQINNLEKNILLQLKQFWSYPQSLNHWSASKSSDHCTWPEIICNENSVTGLDLSSKDLRGKIPPYICDLKNLTVLDFWNNWIPGSFPTGLYNCSNLRHLDLSDNYFVDIIPGDVDKLSQLNFLNLGGNNFTGDIPAAIGRLSELVTLKLSGNQFNGSFPPEIGNLSNLEVLEFSHFTKLPPWTLPSNLFTKLTKLKNLFMTESHLIGEIPESIGNLAALEMLDFSDNKLSGKIPDGLFLLKNLTVVYLYANKLSGSIPLSIKSLNMEQLDLSVNNLTGTIPEDIGKLAKLSGLSLFLNKLSGEIPVSIGRLPLLTDIRLFNNSLSGELPQDFGRFSMLENFEVSINKFVGNLPDNLCYNGVLRGLVVFDNNLSGEIPKSLGNCSSLDVFYVSGNHFSGKIPDGLWTSLNITEMIVGHNSFIGQLPDKISSNLSLLEIDSNNFSGEIPVGISSWKNLVEFVASNNQFNGSIPEELTSLPLLEKLQLDRNLLSGFLPKSFISWTSLTILNLSRNHISGPIPAQLGSLSKLADLDLSENEFLGPIPSEISRLRLPSLNLSSNHLIGKIPGEYEYAAFDSSFLNNTDLCSNNPSVGIKICNSRPITRGSNGTSHKFKTTIIFISVILFILAILFSLYVISLYRKRKRGSDLRWKLTSFQKLNFTESTILSSLTEENVIGSGGSGKVYRVPVNRSGEYVAVKKIGNNRKLDKRLENEFNSEVQYMENGSLDQWLHGNKRASKHSDSMPQMILDWPHRMQIAVGAARGLYFGLAKILEKDGGSNSVSVVAGSFGYLAPEYAHSARVDEKIDVYSFGVILLELVTGREANEGDEDMTLVEWAWNHITRGKPMINAIDMGIKEPSYLNEMISVFKLGIICTGTLPSTRPSMKEVLKILIRTCHSKEYGEMNNVIEVDSSPLLKNS